MGRAGGRIRLLACRVALAAGASVAWLLAAPAQANSTSTVTATAPTNLLSGDDASFSTSIGTWSDYSDASLAWVANAGEVSSGGLVATATGPKMAVLSATSGNGGLTPATPDSIYSGAISAESVSVSQFVQPLLVFYTSSGTQITSVFGPATKVGPTQWTQSAPVVAIAPTNTASVALGVIVYNGGAGAKVAFDNAWIEQSAQSTTPSVVGPLSTSGNRILQASGAQFVPRGVVLNGLETSPTASTVTQNAVVQAKAWGANIVRLPLGEQFWLPSNCNYSPGYQAEVTQVVNWITSLGMVALLDLHTNTVLGCQGGSPHNMADENQSPTFWSQVALRFASNPLVAFDLYNEPHNISNQVWLSGGMTIDSYAPYFIYQAAGMQQLYAAVRGQGAQNLVFVSGVDWANHPPSQLVNGNNIVYAIHAYTCQDAPPPSCASPTPYDPSAILDPWVSFSASHPVAITEFGWPSQSDGTYIGNVINYAATQGWGWIAFAWEDSHDPAAWDITARWLPGLPAQPAPSGIPVICELARVSTGYSPCGAPAASAPPSPTAQVASPKAPSVQVKPPNGPTAVATGSAPKVLPASGTSIRAAAINSLRAVRSACSAACGTNAYPMPAAYSHPSSVPVSGHSRFVSVSAILRIAGVLALIGIFLFGPLPRRLRPAVPEST